MKEFLLSCRNSREEGDDRGMDEDILMAMLGNITQELSDLKTDVNSIGSNVSCVYHMDDQLNRIIELLEQIANK
ncbi:hypothetical protein ACTNDY_06635 [Tissierellaceae bacterium HCP3S3_D8]|jgi:hypothetical protein